MGLFKKNKPRFLVFVAEHTENNKKYIVKKDFDPPLDHGRKLKSTINASNLFKDQMEELEMEHYRKVLKLITKSNLSTSDKNLKEAKILAKSFGYKVQVSKLVKLPKSF